MKFLKIIITKLLVCMLLIIFSTGQVGAEDKKPVTGVWQPLPLESIYGIKGERFDLYRNVRAPYLLESGFLIDGFENRPGVHPWQGEHIGKFFHTVVLDYLITKDPKTKRKLDDLVKRLIATQMGNGYLGTYHPSQPL